MKQKALRKSFKEDMLQSHRTRNVVLSNLKRTCHGVIGNFAPESFRPGYLAAFSRTSNINFEAGLF